MVFLSGFYLLIAFSSRICLCFSQKGQQEAFSREAALYRRLSWSGWLSGVPPSPPAPCSRAEASLADQHGEKDGKGAEASRLPRSRHLPTFLNF